MENFVIRCAEAAGFDLVGFSPIALNDELFKHYEGWVTAGHAGSMAYMTREVEPRRSATSRLAGAQSVICLGANYYRAKREVRRGGAQERGEAQGQVARYAYGRDYHKVIEKMLKGLVTALCEHFPHEHFKAYVDTGPILERSYAEQAGLGYIGKNTCLITPEYGSWVFLAEVVTTLSLKSLSLKPTTRRGGADAVAATCGYCRLCLDICPTGALVGPGELDARRCISYLTIENRGSIPEELRPLIGDWLYGCDLCQEVCPKNAVAQDSVIQDSAIGKGKLKPVGGPMGGPHFSAIRIGGDVQPLAEILQLRTKEAFDARFAGSAMRRAKREGLVRNACVVAANLGAQELLPLLHEVATTDESAMVREHAAWAVAQLA